MFLTSKTLKRQTWYLWLRFHVSCGLGQPSLPSYQVGLGNQFSQLFFYLAVTWVFLVASHMSHMYANILSFWQKFSVCQNRPLAGGPVVLGVPMVGFHCIQHSRNSVSGRSDGWDTMHVKPMGTIVCQNPWYGFCHT